MVDTPLRGDLDLVRNVVRSVNGVVVTRLAAGAPTTGYHFVGDIHTDKNGVAYVCLASGTPGTWGTLASTATKFAKYNNVTTAGLGVPAVYGYGRSAAQTGQVASVATYTVGAADGSFLVSGNVLVTVSTTHSFNLQVTYTDEGGTARTVTMNVQQLGGTLVTAITNITGVGPYEGLPLHLRCKAATAITVLTAGTFTSITYNVEGAIVQLA